MEDREKIKIALKECVRQIGYGCERCPYRGKSCVDRLHLDILAMLEEQEPKRTFKNGIEKITCGVCGSVLSTTIHSIPD